MRIFITGGGGQLGRALPGVLTEHELVVAMRSELDVSVREAVFTAVAAAQPEIAEHILP